MIRNLPLIIIGFSSIFVSSCGFRPQFSFVSPSAEALRTIKIHPIAEREGLLLNNFLSRFTEVGETTYQYDVYVTLNIDERDTALARDFTAVRKEIKVIAHFKIKDRLDPSYHQEGRCEAARSYNISNKQTYHTLANTLDSKTKLTQSLAYCLITKIPLSISQSKKNPIQAPKEAS